MNARSVWSSASRVSRYSIHKPIARCITTASQTGGKFSTDLSAYSSVSHAVAPLNSYGLIKVTGKDASTFLQGLVTNDITDANHPNTYNAILAPSGKYLYDCFISQFDDYYLMETDTNMISNVIKHLKKYKLRAKVQFENVSDNYRIWSVLTAPKLLNSTYEQMIDKEGALARVCYIDPRYDGLGIRIILNKNEIPHYLSNDFVPIGEDFYYALKCIYGIPTHGTDLISDKTIILESNFNYLNGVSFTKGCYVGQELITRTHHRGQIRKRLFGATIEKKDNNNDTSTDRVKSIINNNSDRDTILPTDIISIEDNEYDYVNRNILDIQSNKVAGKITSDENSINCCIVQLRNNAFVDINSNHPKTVGLQIQDTDYTVIPHYTDYFTSFSELFAGKE